MNKAPKPDVWMPLYVEDWDRKTRHLDCEQDGAYGRLVRHYWMNGALADDDAQLARIVGMERSRWRRVRPAIAAFFEIREGRWIHERVESELTRARELIEKRRQNGARGGRPRKQTETETKPDGFPGDNRMGKLSETPARVEVDVLLTSQLEPTSQIPSEDSSEFKGSSSDQTVIPLAGRVGR